MSTVPTQVPVDGANGSGRQLPPVPEDGMLVNLDQESKLHAWLLQGMTKTGRLHWKECAEYYKRHKPTLTEVYAKEDYIKHDQYHKALNHIGPVLDMQGRLLWLSIKCEYLSKICSV